MPFINSYFTGAGHCPADCPSPSTSPASSAAAGSAIAGASACAWAWFAAVLGAAALLLPRGRR